LATWVIFIVPDEQYHLLIAIYRTFKSYGVATKVMPYESCNVLGWDFNAVTRQTDEVGWWRFASLSPFLWAYHRQLLTEKECIQIEECSDIQQSDDRPISFE